MADATPAAEQKKKGLNWVKIITFGSIFGVVLVVGATVASLLPTNVQAVSDAFEPFAIDTGRQGKVPGGCALNQLNEQGACKPVPQGKIVYEEIAFPSRLRDKWLKNVKGTVSKLDSVEGRRPAIVLLHGSGPNSRDMPAPGDLVRKEKRAFRVFKHLGDWFAQQGFVVLRYDKRACGNCYPEIKNADFSKFSFRDFVSDGKDALQYLRTRSDVDPNALVVGGISQGGGLAPVVVEKEPGVVAMMSFAGLFESFGTASVKQLQQYSDIRLGQGDVFNVINLWVARTTIETCFAKLKEDYKPDEQCIGGGVPQSALKEYEEDSARVVEVMEGLDMPIFASHGTADRNVDPAVFKTTAERLKAKGKDIDFHLIAGMGHIHTDVLADKSPPDGLHPKFLEALQSFVSSVKVAAPAE